MKALVSSDKLPAPAGPYSPGVTVGEWIFLSGQGGFDPNTGKVVSDDLVEQTEQTFNNIETVLEAAGASLDDVISCLVHLVDLADFPAFNAVYEQKFTGVKPVRTTVRADLVAGLLVEITVVARASCRAMEFAATCRSPIRSELSRRPQRASCIGFPSPSTWSVLL
jgi:2-iminobutanoate/2-iminopropanoate deaminase